MKSLLIAVALFSQMAHAQVVYKCDGGYTDKPCKDGAEVPIQATEGAHSLSGQKKQSSEAYIRDVNRSSNKALERALENQKYNNQCERLKQERIAIDAKTNQSENQKTRRFEIRKIQYELKCKSS